MAHSGLFRAAPPRLPRWRAMRPQRRHCARLAKNCNRPVPRGGWCSRCRLAAIEVDHLLRDRIHHDDEDMAALRESLRARGQQTPIDLVDLGQWPLRADLWLAAVDGAWRSVRRNRRGAFFPLFRVCYAGRTGRRMPILPWSRKMKSGWRLAIMNAARIAAKAAEAGVYPDVQTALRHLFSSASRAKRSKIGTFRDDLSPDGCSVTVSGGDFRTAWVGIGCGIRGGCGAWPAPCADAGQGQPANPSGRTGAAGARFATCAGGACRPRAKPKWCRGSGCRWQARGRAARYTLSGPGLGADFGARLADWLRKRR